VISFLKGLIVQKQPTRVVLEVAGVGYEVLIPLSTYDRLPARGEACCLLTVDYVREDCHQLFGFMTEPERALFALLMGTSGVGPKLALSALSGMSVRDLRTAVVEGDVARLSSVSGIGKKMAERIIVDLRDKVGKGEALEAASGATPGTEAESKRRDALMALVALGYKREAADKMVRNALRKGSASLSVEAIIRMALSGSTGR